MDIGVNCRNVKRAINEARLRDIVRASLERVLNEYTGRQPMARFSENVASNNEPGERDWIIREAKKTLYICDLQDATDKIISECHEKIRHGDRFGARTLLYDAGFNNVDALSCPQGSYSHLCKYQVEDIVELKELIEDLF